MGASMRLAFRFTLFYPSKQKRAERHIQVAFLVSHKQKSPKRKKAMEETFLPWMRSSPVCELGTLRLFINKRVLFSELSACYPL